MSTQGVAGKSQNKLPKEWPGITTENNNGKFYERVKLEDIGFKEIFSSKNFVVFHMTTECSFIPSKISLDLLQNNSECNLGSVKSTSTEEWTEMRDLIKKMKNINFIFTITPNGVKAVSEKVAEIQNYKVNDSIYNDDTYKNYFIVKRLSI